MAEFHIGSQQAKNIYQGENVHVNAAPEPPDHEGLAEHALAIGDYENAQLHFAEAVRLSNDVGRLRFGLALATLRGHRPRQHRRATIDTVLGHLRTVPLAEAAALLLLVEEDYHAQWRFHQPMPAQVTALLRQVPPSSAAEIVRHIHAPESQTWQFLSALATRA